MIILRNKMFAKFKASGFTPEIKKTLKDLANKNHLTYEGFLGHFKKSTKDVVKRDIPIGKLVKLNEKINSREALETRAVREALRKAGV